MNAVHVKFFIAFLKKNLAIDNLFYLRPYFTLHKIGIKIMIANPNSFSFLMRCFIISPLNYMLDKRKKEV